MQSLVFGTRHGCAMVKCFILIMLLFAFNQSAGAQMAPVSPLLQTGCKFDEANLGALEVESSWFHIPKWFAGTWKREKTTHKVLGLLPVTRMDIRKRKYGFQTDSKGGIWHLIRTPFKVTTQTPGCKNYFIIWKEEPLSVKQDAVTVHMLWTHWQVSNSTGIIEKVFQGDQIDVFYPEASGVMKADSSVKSFSESGQFIRAWTCKWIDTRTEEYQPVELYRGAELKPLLIDFLKSIGKLERAGMHENTE